MADLYLGSRVRVLAGARYERTSLDYTGYEVLFDDEGDFASISALSRTNGYGHLLPMAHLRVSLDEHTNLRAAATRTLARPNFYDLAPYTVIFREDLEILRGNPDLRPTTAWNFDLLAERYFQSVGVASAGVFYKRLSDYIFPFSFEEVRSGDEFQVIQPLNGEQASVRGFEAALQSQLRFLPSPLDGVGLYLNYTFTDSEATFPERTSRSTLPGQARHVGNVSLSYEKGGFMGRASVNFHGSYVDLVVGDQVGADGIRVDQDRYYDRHTQLDVTASQAVTSHIRLFAEALNLTNEPLRYYRGTSDRPDQEEYYKWWAAFGVKVNF
jgi:TonB-dependent receptor